MRTAHSPDPTLCTFLFHRRTTGKLPHQMNSAFVLFVKLIYEMKDNSMIYHKWNANGVDIFEDWKNLLPSHACLVLTPNTVRAEFRSRCFCQCPIERYYPFNGYATCYMQSECDSRLTVTMTMTMTESIEDIATIWICFFFILCRSRCRFHSLNDEFGCIAREKNLWYISINLYSMLSYSVSHTSVTSKRSQHNYRMLPYFSLCTRFIQ